MSSDSDDEFLSKYREKIASKQYGDPESSKSSDVRTLANRDGGDNIDDSDSNGDDNGSDETVILPTSVFLFPFKYFFFRQFNYQFYFCIFFSEMILATV